MFNSGGFDQSGGFMMQGSSASPADKPKNVRRQDNVFPVCLKQIRQASEDGLKFGDTRVHMVELVIIVRSINIETTSVEYLLDDNTAGLSGVYWIERNEDGDAVGVPDVVENAYYRVYGTIRSLQGKKYVQVVKIMPIKNVDEITTHILDVMHKPLLFEKMASMESVKAPSMADPSLSNSFMSSTNMSAVTGFNPMQQKVYNVILKSQQDIGIHKSDIVKQLEGSMNSRDILNVVEFLSTEGHIYTTIDEEHYRCTDN